MKTWKRWTAGILTAVMLSGMVTLGASASGFARSRSYTPGQFTDVADNAWYAASVRDCYELGLMSGSSATAFSPAGMFTLAEAATIAARMHNIYNGGNGTISSAAGPWYQGAVDYCVEKGIFAQGDFDSYTRPAFRAEMAGIMAAALPKAAWTAKNKVTELPDVSGNTPNSQAIFQLYNAGVFTGSDKYGMFQPYAYITRAEVAAIVARCADESQRKTLSLTPLSQREAPVLPVPGTNLGAMSHGRVAFKDPNTNLYGYLDTNAAVVIPAVYEWAGPFYSDRTEVRQNGKRGIIDINGRVIIPTLYDHITRAGNGYVVQVDNSQYGFYDLNGNMVADLVYSGLYSFAEGVVGEPLIARKGKLQGLCDADGREVLPCVYEEVKGSRVDKDTVYYICKGGGNYSVFTPKGELVGTVPDSYLPINGRLFAVKDGNKYAFASFQGLITEAIYDGYRNKYPEKGSTRHGRNEAGGEIIFATRKTTNFGSNLRLIGLTGEIAEIHSYSEDFPVYTTKYGYAVYDGTPSYYTSLGKISKEEAKAMEWTESSPQRSNDLPKRSTSKIPYKNDLFYDEAIYLGEGYSACRWNTTWYLVY